MITKDKQRKVILKKISEMPQKDLENVMAFIQSLEDKELDDLETHFASEQVLAKDWNKKEEEKAWQDL